MLRFCLPYFVGGQGDIRLAELYDEVDVFVLVEEKKLSKAETKRSFLSKTKNLKGLQLCTLIHFNISQKMILPLHGRDPIFRFIQFLMPSRPFL